MSTVLNTETSGRADPRIARSEIAIQSALLDQLRLGRDLSSLTVSEVAEQAGVTRKTFYARFGSLEQLAERMVFDLFSDIEADIGDEMLRLPLKDSRLSVMVFDGYRAYQSTLAPLIQHCPAGVFITPVCAVIRRLLQRAATINQTPKMSEMGEAYLVSMLASVVHGVLAVWVERGLADSPDQVASFIDALLVPGIQRVLISGSA